MVLVSALSLAASPARAGIPYATDDPGTPDAGHYQVNVTSQFTSVAGDTSGTLLGVELNYGLTDHFQPHAYVPLSFDHSTGGATETGIGDAELGFKYRFVDGDDHGWRPDIAIAPTLMFASGDHSRSLGTGRVHAFLPIWIGKESGKWAVFGGGGYALNPGADNKNWWSAGIGVTYQLTQRVNVGTEIFHTTPDIVEGRPGTAFKFGLVYDVNETHHPMISIGRGLGNEADTARLSVFIADQIRF